MRRRAHLIWVPVLAATLLGFASPAVASSPAARYVLATATAARQLHHDFDRMFSVWFHNKHDYGAWHRSTVLFDRQITVLRHAVAPSPTDHTSRAYQPEKQIRTAIVALTHAVHVLAQDFADGAPVKRINTDLARFTKSVLSYDGGLRVVWSLAHVPSPPYL
jgi:hypothetical protein